MYISGIATGLDTETLVQQLMAIERRPLVLMQERKNLLQQQRDAWRDINTRLNNLRDRMAELSRTSLFEGRSAVSSAADVATASATRDAAEARYNIEVVQLAQSHRVASAKLEGAIGYTGSAWLAVGDRDPVVIEIDADDTVHTIAEKINEADVAVTARVIDGRLVIQADETGEAHQLKFEGALWRELGITGDDGEILDTAQLQSAQDAVFKIEGLTIARSSNKIDDVIEGVTFTLQGEGETVIDIKRDEAAVLDAVRKFVEQYNSTMSFIQSRSSDGGVLQGDTLLMRIAFQLRSDITARVDGAGLAYNQLAAVGISIDRHGTMTLNEAKLREALADDPEAVQKLFAATQDADGFDGVTARLESRFQAWLQAGDGLLAARQKMFGDRMKAIDDSIEQMERRLEIREQNLMRQFIALEEVMAAFQTQAMWLEGQINQLNLMTAASAQRRR
ncbi:MAG: flagellar filament capping protein FliD [Limnochordales bacterium]